MAFITVMMLRECPDEKENSKSRHKERHPGFDELRNILGIKVYYVNSNDLVDKLKGCAQREIQRHPSHSENNGLFHECFRIIIPVSQGRKRG